MNKNNNKNSNKKINRKSKSKDNNKQTNNKVKNNRKNNRKSNRKSNRKNNRKSNRKSNKQVNIKNIKNIKKNVNNPILNFSDIIPFGSGLFSSDDTKKILKEVYNRIKKQTDNPESGLAASKVSSIKSIWENNKLTQINDTRFYKNQILSIKADSESLISRKNTSRYLRNNNLDFYHYLVEGEKNLELIKLHSSYKEGSQKLKENKNKIQDSKGTSSKISYNFAINYNNEKDLYQILARAVDEPNYYFNIMSNEDKVVLYSLLANIFYKKLLENIQKIRIESKGYIEIAKTLGTGIGESSKDISKRVSNIKEASDLPTTGTQYDSSLLSSTPLSSISYGGKNNYNEADTEKYYKIVVNNLLDILKEPILYKKHSDLSDTYVEERNIFTRKCLAAGNYCTSGLVYRKINDPIYNRVVAATDMTNIELDNKIFHSLREARKYLNLAILESQMAYLFRYGSKNATDKKQLLKTNNIYEVLDDNSSVLKTLQEKIIDNYIKDNISPSSTSISSIISSTEPSVINNYSPLGFSSGMNPGMNFGMNPGMNLGMNEFDLMT